MSLLDKFLLFNKKNTYQSKIYGIPVRGLNLLFWVSKTTLVGTHNDANVYSVHITPLFSFSFTIPVNKSTPDFPVREPWKNEITYKNTVERGERWATN